MYKVFLKESAKKTLKKLDNSQRKTIIKKLRNLEKNPELGKPLLGNLKGFRSLRIEKFRVIYIFFQEKLIISVLEIGHRKNIYN